ncbi:MAG: pro-sigmaK processing inhibitor BofA family protein [Candidatus Diapherotrites archaeon]|nr:pro-sigmaK processing inhibitor BofA family protein [Candidatus Diapherotrites archaeon]
MSWFLLQSQIGELTNSGVVSQAANFLSGNWTWLLIGIALIGITIWLITQVKNLIVNSLLGIVAWAIVTYALPMVGINIQLNFVTSLIASALLGVAGIGLMIVLKFIGLQI